MGTLESLTNTKGQSLLTPVNPDTTPRHLLGISGVDVGQDADAAWLGIATHQNGGVVNGTDGVQVIAGPNPDNSDQAEPAQVIDGRLQVTASTVGPDTAALSNVADNNADTLILAANVARKGAAIWNDSPSILYLSLGTTAASLTACTVKIGADDYYEVPFGFTGQIRGIWSANTSGAARVTELT